MNNSWIYDEQINFIDGGFPVTFIEITGAKPDPVHGFLYEIKISYDDGYSKVMKGLTREHVLLFHSASGQSRPDSWEPAVPRYQTYHHDVGPYRKPWEYRGDNPYIYDDYS